MAIINFFKSKKVVTPPVVEKPVEVTPIPKPIEIPSEKQGEIANFKFVDSSHHHPDFDPKKYTAPILSNKCTQGIGFVDDTHAKRKKLCAENKIKYTGYHFYMCNQDPIDQVDHYMQTHGDFIHRPQVDYETTTGQEESDLIKGKENLLIFLRELKKRTGMAAILYVNYSAAFRIKFDERFAEFPGWFARYYSETLGPIPAPWNEKNYFAHQYTDKGSFPGFSGGNDVNIYNGKANVLNLE